MIRMRPVKTVGRGGLRSSWAKCVSMNVAKKLMACCSFEQLCVGTSHIKSKICSQSLRYVVKSLEFFEGYEKWRF